MIVSKYEIIQKIGFGEFANVFLAKNTENNTEVALKTFSEKTMERIGWGQFDDNGYLDLYNYEIQALKDLTSREDNVYTCKLIDNFVVNNVENNDRYYFIIMNNIKGKTLRQLIIEKKHFSPEAIIIMIYWLIIGLKFIHDANISHGDVLEKNIMLTDDGSIQYIDFGKATELNNFSKKVDYDGLKYVIKKIYVLIEPNCNNYNELISKLDEFQKFDTLDEAVSFSESIMETQIQK